MGQLLGLRGNFVLACDAYTNSPESHYAVVFDTSDIILNLSKECSSRSINTDG